MALAGGRWRGDSSATAPQLPWLQECWHSTRPASLQAPHSSQSCCAHLHFALANQFVGQREQSIGALRAVLRPHELHQSVGLEADLQGGAGSRRRLWSCRQNRHGCTGQRTWVMQLPISVGCTLKARWGATQISHHTPDPFNHTCSSIVLICCKSKTTSFTLHQLQPAGPTAAHLLQRRADLLHVERHKLVNGALLVAHRSVLHKRLDRGLLGCGEHDAAWDRAACMLGGAACLADRSG